MHATNARQLVDPRAGLAAVAAAVTFAAGVILGTMIQPDASTVGSQRVPLGDRRYDAVEENRLDLGSEVVPLGDRRYDAVEENRLDFGSSIPLGDRRYDAVEENRLDSGID
jgi:hypothetical protein